MNIDLGCGGSRTEGYVGVDLRPQEDIDIVCDLTKGWPFRDCTIDRLRASHIVEHLSDSLHTMNEAFRVLKPGSEFEIDVPSTKGAGAFCDPTHKSFWNFHSFMYYDMRVPLGGMYGCNKWEILGIHEYNVSDIYAWGPYIKALLRKPKDAC